MDFSIFGRKTKAELFEIIQSKQSEIDALKAKIDELKKWAEFHIEDYNLSESESEHDRGWFNAACQVLKKLKENNNDT